MVVAAVAAAKNTVSVLQLFPSGYMYMRALCTFDEQTVFFTFSDSAAAAVNYGQRDIRIDLSAFVRLPTARAASGEQENICLVRRISKVCSARLSTVSHSIFAHVKNRLFARVFDVIAVVRCLFDRWHICRRKITFDTRTLGRNPLMAGWRDGRQLARIYRVIGRFSRENLITELNFQSRLVQLDRLGLGDPRQFLF